MLPTISHREAKLKILTENPQAPKEEVEQKIPILQLKSALESGELQKILAEMIEAINK